MRFLKNCRGATLVEMVMAIAVLGVVSATCLVFMQSVFKGYEQTRERLIVADQGRLALTRFKREMRLSLPNSVRVATVAGSSYLEFVPVVASGRYRVGSGTGSDATDPCAADDSTQADNSVLSVGLPDTCLKPLGPFDASEVPSLAWLVVFNVGVGQLAGDFYQSGNVTGGNKAKVLSATATKITFERNTFTWDSPGRRFFITPGPVTYACDPVAKTLTRWMNYRPSATQPTSAIGSQVGATARVIARNVTSCRFTYAPASVSSQFGLVTFALEHQTPGGDKLILQSQALVGNTP